MNVNFSHVDVSQYHSASQIARIKTENWVAQNMYCPRCGNLHINHFENNRPVADFYCPSCKNEFELKSKTGSLTKKINDGAYETMIERITSNQNPDFFFMNYSIEDDCVKDLILIPKHFFVPDIIEKRKPLAETARRAGWVGCNILIGKIPEQGRVNIIENGKINSIQAVIQKVNRGKLLATDDLNARGWLLDVLTCINSVQFDIFSLSMMYDFCDFLSVKHPNNNNIQAKIRQQLQQLRDLGFIEFLGHGQYRKIK